MRNTDLVCRASLTLAEDCAHGAEDGDALFRRDPAAQGICALLSPATSDSCFHPRGRAN